MITYVAVYTKVYCQYTARSVTTPFNLCPVPHACSPTHLILFNLLLRLWPMLHMGVQTMTVFPVPPPPHMLICLYHYPHSHILLSASTNSFMESYLFSMLTSMYLLYASLAQSPSNFIISDSMFNW